MKFMRFLPKEIQLLKNGRTVIFRRSGVNALMVSRYDIGNASMNETLDCIVVCIKTDSHSLGETTGAYAETTISTRYCE